MKTKKASGLLLSLIFSASIYAQTNGIPLDPNGDTVPVPNGNIPYFSMPYALAAGNGEFTWDYSGTVGNANEEFSLQAVIAQFLGNGQVGLGYHSLYFAFQKNGDYFYSSDSYGGEKNVNQALAQTLDWVSSSVDFKKFQVTADSVIGGQSAWTVQTVGRIPQPPLYKGWVGQPGHEYQLTGRGTTYLWKYDAKTGEHTIAPYQYHLSVTMLDVRGATMEGLGAGYVGPALAPMPSASTSYNVESEIAQPQLKVLNWQVDFTALNTQEGFKQQYAFNGNSGMMWDDFGPVVKVPPINSNAAEHLSNLIQSALPGDFNQKLNVSDLGEKLQASTQAKGLYNGNWLPVTFTTGKYKGASLVFTVFWNQTQNHSGPQSTANYDWSRYGWCNYFSGLVHGEVDSANALLETLYPENPLIPTREQAQTQTPPYTVSLDSFDSSKYQMAYPWAQTVTVTIKANTPLRYALAAYADQLAKSNTADDPSQPIVIKLQAISPITQNTLFSKTITQFYEGAAIPTINGEKVGYAWIEHMV